MTKKPTVWLPICLFAHWNAYNTHKSEGCPVYDPNGTNGDVKSRNDQVLSIVVF